MAVLLFRSYSLIVKINKSGVLTVAGIAALFLGFAGSANAISFSIRDTLDSGVHWGNQHNNPNHSETAPVLDRQDQPGRSFGLTDSSPVGMNRGYEMETYRHQDWRHHSFTRGHPGSTSPKPDVPATNVPEGGMTVTMVGFALAGLAFMRKILPI